MRQADEAALLLLAREAGGSMRDAERMLETSIASLDGKVTESEVASILGVASRSRVFGYRRRDPQQGCGGALRKVRELHRSGANLESLGRDLLEVLRNIAVAKFPSGNDSMSPLADLPDQEAAELKRLAERASNRDVMRLFRSDGRCAGAIDSLALSRPADGDGGHSHGHARAGDRCRRIAARDRRERMPAGARTAVAAPR